MINALIVLGVVLLVLGVVLPSITMRNILGWTCTGPHDWRWQVLLGPWMYERALRQPPNIKASRCIWGVLVRFK